MNIRKLRTTAAWRAARRVIEWYQKEDITQMKMAERCGKDQAFVSALVNGKVPIPAHDFDRFADLLGIRVSELVAAEDGAMWDPEEFVINAWLHESPNRKRHYRMLAVIRQDEIKALKERKSGDDAPPAPKVKTAGKIRK
jgi:transcriptional regulator with XRE-family HTH domain